MPRTRSTGHSTLDDGARTGEPADVRTSIVLPAYNEAGNLRPLVE